MPEHDRAGDLHRQAERREEPHADVDVHEREDRDDPVESESHWGADGGGSGNW